VIAEILDVRHLNLAASLTHSTVLSSRFTTVEDMANVTAESAAQMFQTRGYKSVIGQLSDGKTCEHPLSPCITSGENSGERSSSLSG
jgi:hypothetical protein